MRLRGIRSGRRRGRAFLVSLAVLALLFMPGCKAEVRTLVTVHPDGSGVVTVSLVLDSEASAKAGDLRKVLKLDDLRKVGWQVKGPGPAAEVLGPTERGDGTAVQVSRPFRTVAEANRILGSLSGPSGPYRNVELRRTHSFAATRIAVTGTVDLRSGLDGVGDGALTSALGGQSVSQVVAVLNDGKPVAPGEIKVTLAAAADGLTLSGDGTSDAAADGARAVSAGNGDQPVSLDVAGSRRHWTSILWAVGAVVALLAAAALFVLDRLPGRKPPTPRRLKQHHSGRDGWDLVQRRGGPAPPKSSAS